MNARGIGGLLIGVLVFACSSRSGQDPPTQSAYSLVFPSTRAAVAVDGIKLYVFDASLPNNDCATLVQFRKTKQDLPVRLVESPNLSPCDLLHGTGSLEISYGQRSILAVALRQGADFLIGCGSGPVEPSAEPVSISMFLANNLVVVPSTTCTDVSQRCASQCQ